MEASTVFVPKIGRNAPFFLRHENNIMADAGRGSGGKICILSGNEIQSCSAE
jgi:hypothetical protein